MLVLSRKKQERIVIGEGENEVWLKVLAIKGDKVTIGLDAPRDVRIRRAEHCEGDGER